jgi:NADPH:quinone reductase-like Zn-dependent oxidoreductase
MRAVRFDHYGGRDVLQFVEVERPSPERGRVLVRVKAAGINPGEVAIREGRLHDIYPASFPEGEGSDLAGVVEEIGEGVEGWNRGDEVLGFTNSRASHADFVLVDADKLAAKPANVPWEVAGSLFVAGTTAYACVRAVAPQEGETVVVSAAAGGVGSLAVQLARRTGATVIGLASRPHHAWLSRLGVVPASYDGPVAAHIRAVSSGRIDAFIDAFGARYVELALELGVRPERIDTIANFAAAKKYGVKTEGSAAAANAEVLGELARLISEGKLEVPIARIYRLDEVRDAYRDVEQRHTLGKIVLRP